jgi:hypothetical protein
VSSVSAQAGGSHENDMRSNVQFAWRAEDGVSPQQPKRAPGCGRAIPEACWGPRRCRKYSAHPERSMLRRAVTTTRVTRLDVVAGIHILRRL